MYPSVEAWPLQGTLSEFQTMVREKEARCQLVGAEAGCQHPAMSMDGPSWKLSLSWEGVTTKWGIGRMPGILMGKAGG